MPSILLVHSALIAAQVIFGGGAVIGKFGINGTNPILFALVREGISGPILLLLGQFIQKESIQQKDIIKFLWCGIFIFGNQFAFIIGLKLSDPTTGSMWQPLQPVFTAFIALAIGLEKFQLQKFVGIFISVGGCLFLILYRASSTSENTVMGDIFFFLNCLATSLYVICSKPLTKNYQSINVTAYSYIIASVLMAITALVMNTSDSTVQFICQDKNKVIEQLCIDQKWVIPQSMILPLIYWILGNSVMAYSLITWGNQYAEASHVMCYTVLQPVTVAILCTLLICINGQDFADKYGLQNPGIQDVGGIFIFIGLLLIIKTKSTEEYCLIENKNTDSLFQDKNN